MTFWSSMPSRCLQCPLGWGGRGGGGVLARGGGGGVVFARLAAEGGGEPAGAEFIPE